MTVLRVLGASQLLDLCSLNVHERRRSQGRSTPGNCARSRGDRLFVTSVRFTDAFSDRDGLRASSDLSHPGTSGRVGGAGGAGGAGGIDQRCHSARGRFLHHAG